MPFLYLFFAGDSCHYRKALCLCTCVPLYMWHVPAWRCIALMRA
jgi:hypothetical protein